MRDVSQRHFVLAGVSVFERQTYWLSQEIDRIAERFNPSEPNTVEIHASPMRGGQKFWRQFKVADRLQAMADTLRVATGKTSGVNLFAAVVDKKAIAPDDPVSVAFEKVCRSFDIYLMKMHKRRDTQRGVVIFDKASYEQTIQNLAIDFRTVGHTWGVVRNLAEVPLFLDSRASRMIQLADVIAFAVFRHYEHQDSTLFDIIASRFDSIAGTTYGLSFSDKPSTLPLPL